MGRRGKGSTIVGEIGAHSGGTRGSGKGGRKELVTSAYLGESECYGSWGIEESVPCTCVLCVCVCPAYCWGHSRDFSCVAG